MTYKIQFTINTHAQIHYLLRATYKVFCVLAQSFGLNVDVWNTISSFSWQLKVNYSVVNG